MSTYRQVVFMIMDYLKISSDDAYYTPDHIKFMLNKYRAYVLKSKYENSTTQPDEQNYQTISMPVEEVLSVEGYPCEGKYLRTKEKLPAKSPIGINEIYAEDFLKDTFNWITPQRFRYAGTNKWLKNMIYATKGDDGRLYLKSCNPQLYYLENIKVRAIFANPEEAAGLDVENMCAPLDMEYPLEDNFLPLVMQYVVKEFNGASYRPQDTENNASDDLSTLAQFIRTYMKKPLQRQLE